MTAAASISELQEFPCDYMFKAMGANDPPGLFGHQVRNAVRKVVQVAEDAVKERPSSGGKYVSVSVLVRLENEGQLREIYALLKQIEGMRFLL